MNVPANLLYTESDEWVRRESDGTLTLGITDYAQGELGEIVYLELPQISDNITIGGSFGVAESVKAVGELHSPLAGTVVAINSAATENPGLLNESPYEEGWLIQIKPSDDTDLTSLMDSDKYTAYRS